MKKFNNVFSRFPTRKFKVGSMATAITVIVTAIIIVFNLIVNQLAQKTNLSMDLTANKIFSLSEQSVDFIRNIDKDVEIVVLSDEDAFKNTDQYFVQANSVLKKYETNSDKIKINYVDVIKNPTYLQEYQDENLTQNSIIVKCGDKHKTISVQDLFDIQSTYYGNYIVGSNAEQELTSALLYVTSDEQVQIVLLKGYGEQDSTAFVEILKKNNFNVSEVSLLTDEIPQETKLAVMFAPERDFDSSSIDKLEKFLDQGDKSLIYALNFNQAASPNLNAFFEKNSIKIKDGVVYETNTQNMVSNLLSVIPEYVDADYKNGLKNKDIPVLMPYGRPFELTNTENTKTLLQCSATAGVVDKNVGNDFDWKGNISGPIPSVVISKINAENEEKSSNIAVVSSYLALSQVCLDSNALNNSTYFVNMINMMTDKEVVGLTLESKNLSGEELGVNKASADMIGIIMAIVLPLIVLSMGIVVFFKRRNK